MLCESRRYLIERWSLFSYLALRFGPEPDHLAVRRSPMTHDCRTGGGADPGCALSQNSRFNSISSASSASARSRAGIRERNALGLSSWRGHVFGRWTKGVESGRRVKAFHRGVAPASRDRKSTRLNSSHSSISYAVFCLKKKN